MFYVISGYLITSLLVQEWEERGTIRLLNFWGRRMRRILPAGVLVLCASLVGAAILLPSTLASRAAHDLPAAALYYINWHLADQAVDYFASTEPSVYLQYWSLAIEEQFYAVWPLIVLLTAMTAARFFRSNASARVYVLWTGIAIGALSFGVCLYLTSQDQPFAFFGTFSRAWQLGLGAAIGLMPLIPINELASRMLAVAGLAAIVLAALVFTSATPYPGIAAVLPTTGAAAIILAGRRGDIGGAVGGALRSPALVRLGKWSYSWYLWHWPILFFGSILLSPESGRGCVPHPAVTPSGLPHVLSHRAARSVLAISGAISARLGHGWPRLVPWHRRLCRACPNDVCQAGNLSKHGRAIER